MFGFIDSSFFLLPSPPPPPSFTFAYFITFGLFLFLVFPKKSLTTINNLSLFDQLTNRTLDELSFLFYFCFVCFILFKVRHFVGFFPFYAFLLIHSHIWSFLVTWSIWKPTLQVSESTPFTVISSRWLKQYMEKYKIIFLYLN